MPDTGTFRVDIKIENPAFPGIGRRRQQDFRQADGTVVTPFGTRRRLALGAVWHSAPFGTPRRLALRAVRHFYCAWEHPHKGAS